MALYGHRAAVRACIWVKILVASAVSFPANATIYFLTVNRYGFGGVYSQLNLIVPDTDNHNLNVVAYYN